MSNSDPLALPFAPAFMSDEEAFAFVENPYGGIRSASEPMTIEEALSDTYGFASAAGVPVNSSVLAQIAAAYACRRVISEDVAKLPRRVVRIERSLRGDKVRVIALPQHPVSKILNDAPNDWMTPFEFMEYFVGVACFHEGSYAKVQRDPRTGSVDEVLPLLPGSCAAEIDTYWNVTYRATGYGTTFVFQPHEILRLNGPMSDPWRGFSTVAIAREAVGLAAAIEASQARFHANDLRPSGVLTTEDGINDVQRDAIRSAWKAAYGPGGQGGVAVLDKKFKFEAIMAEGAKNEVIENRKFQISEICRFFRVMPVMIGHNDGSQTFSSVEAQFNAHGKHTLAPWVKRVEEALTMCLMTPEERANGLRVDLDMDAEMRGTASDRTSMYEKASKIYLTPNEIRVREGLDPIDDPEMDRVQIMRNNTGTAPSFGGVAKPILSPKLPNAATSLPDPDGN